MGLLFIFLLSLFSLTAHQKLYFATSADTEHYEWALNLIATIHRYHYPTLGEIAVFDLGLLNEEKKELERIDKVKVYPVEAVNSDMFTKFKVNETGKIARGWYSWKPVVLKQALDLFPEVLYLDAGVSLTGKCDRIFQLIRKYGVFLIDCGHTIERMLTLPVRKKFDLNQPDRTWVIQELGISAGVQGLTRDVKQIYITPLYLMAFDISNFKDDGTAPKGFGWARHDQTLFSVQARLLGLPVGEGLKKGILHWGNEEKLKVKKFIKFSRGEFDLGASTPFLKYH